jgi:hypothetical protein
VPLRWITMKNDELWDKKTAPPYFLLLNDQKEN